MRLQSYASSHRYIQLPQLQSCQPSLWLSTTGDAMMIRSYAAARRMICTHGLSSILLHSAKSHAMGAHCVKRNPTTMPAWRR
ncbi:hypothetical protein WJX79_007194 [Trebouxia sp. C0005]